MNERVTRLENQVSKAISIGYVSCLLGIAGIAIKLYLPFGLADDPRDKKDDEPKHQIYSFTKR